MRLHAEFIRDVALSVSGLLVRDLGGPGVKPYQPSGLWNEVSINRDLRFRQDHGEKLYRRSLYTYWKRSAPPPALRIFDAPTRERCVIRRSLTNTPLQALITLNDPQFIEAARFLAQRMIFEGGKSLENRVGFVYRLVLARRMAERGVPFIQLFHRAWDQHGNLPRDIRNQCRDIDRASVGLVADLKQRGMLDDTLVIWGGEFGRTIYSQGKLSDKNHGCDHHGRCFTTWLAGGGVKAGSEYGKTDDHSYNIIENPVHIRDLNATVLHLLGIGHERFSFRYQGLDQRLTGVEGAKVVHDIIA